MSIASRLIKNFLKDIGRGFKGNPLPGSFHQDPLVAQRLLLRRQKVENILDVGGNKGQSVREYRKFFPDARIFSFEPYGEVFEELEKVCCEDGRATAVNCAVSNQIGKQQFYITTRTTMNSLFRIVVGDNTVEETEVPTTTLDEFCRQQNLEHIDILKMDIQGGEVLAIEGANRMLESRSIDVIYSEALFSQLYVGQAEFHQLCAQIQRFGYHLFGLYALRINKRHMLTHGNALFISPRIAESLDEQSHSQLRATG